MRRKAGRHGSPSLWICSYECLERHAEALGSVTIFCDHGPEPDIARANLNRMLSETQTGDFIFVNRIDRIADSVSDLH